METSRVGPSSKVLAQDRCHLIHGICSKQQKEALEVGLLSLRCFDDCRIRACEDRTMAEL